jgi:mannuronan 5-epimerase
MSPIPEKPPFMTSRALVGSRRSYRAYQLARGRRAIALAVVLAAAAALGGLLIANRSQAALPNPFAYASAPLSDTAYSIPSGAIVVSNGGSDANPGTLARPKRTLTAALGKVASGGTIVMRGGTYRESPGTIGKRVTIQPYPHEKVWVKGSAVVTGWSYSGGAYVHGSWNPNLCRSCYPGAAIDPRYPMAGQPDQVFMNGAPQRQVSSRSAVKPGTFWFDRSNHKLWVGTNPAGRTVEGTVFTRALQFSGSAAGSTVRGIGFAHYGAHYNFDVPAMVIANAKNVTFVKDTFAWSATRGLSVLTQGAVVTDNRFMDNGANGFHANAASGLDFERNVLAYNNFEQFSIQPSASASIAAAKITSSSNMVIRRNIAVGNWSNGIWLDVSCAHSVVASNTVVRNAGHGIAVELSGYIVVAGNIAASNGRLGIKLSGANDIAAWNNTVANNGWSAFGIYEDPRSNPNPSTGATWNTARVQLVNNVIEGPSGSKGPVLESFDASSPNHTTTQGMLSMDTRNLWSRPSSTAPRFMASWQVSLSTTATYGTLHNLQLAVKREATSLAADGASLSALFVDATHDDYHLSSHSPARVSGVTLPTNVAAAMGVRASVPYLGELNAPFG